MKSKQLLFYTVLEDFENIVSYIESTISIKYCRTGLFENDDILTFNSLLDLPNIGFTLFGDWNKIDNYLITKKTTTISIREVVQRTGETKFAIDQLINPNSIEIKLGGIYKNKENVIIAGRISTVTNDSDSIELYKLFSSKIKKEFKKNSSFYVGNVANEKLNNGWRLVTNEKAKKEFDLLPQTDD
jgi:hypothetical protein